MATEQTNKLKRVLFPVLGVILLIVAAVAVMAQLQPAAEPPASAVEEPDFHETADAATPLVVNFIAPITTEEQYGLLYDMVDRYVITNLIPEWQDIVISVTEDIFIDREDDSDPFSSREQENYTEYDRSYFKNLLMVRYVSQSGQIHVLGARFGEGDTIELIAQDDFSSEHFAAEVVEEEEKKKTGKFWNRTHEELEEKVEAEMETVGSISEETFVACIGQCVIQLLSGAESEARIASHFTAEGMASLERIVQVLGISDKSNIDLLVAEVGTSDLALGTMNRMYLRCGVESEGESIYLNLLLKLNGNLLVYDLDLI